jgi:hypothetical protein
VAGDDEFISDYTTSVLKFCHAYLVKAYEKKVGRA